MMYSLLRLLHSLTCLQFVIYTLLQLTVCYLHVFTAYRLLFIRFYSLPFLVIYPFLQPTVFCHLHVLQAYCFLSFTCFYRLTIFVIECFHRLTICCHLHVFFITDLMLISFVLFTGSTINFTGFLPVVVIHIDTCESM